MASAYECDRCGELYSDEARNRGVYLCDKDLCPRCQSQLDDWFADPNTAVMSFVEVDDDGYKHKSVKIH